MTEMIPISEIDSFIKEFQNKPNHWIKVGTLIAVLKKTKQKAIPAIPISKIDEKITHLEGHGIYIDYDDVDVIKMLEDLKK